MDLVPTDARLTNERGKACGCGPNEVALFQAIFLYQETPRSRQSLEQVLEGHVSSLDLQIQGFPA